MHWCRERELIRQRRNAGLPYPWTNDKVMQATRFTNVRRIDDRVSQYLMMWYTMIPRTAPLMVAAATLGRLVNWPDTLDELYPFGFNRWDKQRVAKIMHKRRTRGDKVFTGAYIVPHGGKPGETKIESTVTKVTAVYEAARKTRLIDNTFQATVENLQTINGIGSFMAGQIAADLAWFTPWREWPDINSWAPMGPGSARGAAWLLGRDRPLRPSDMETFTALLDLLRGMLIDAIPISVCAMDVQNTLCELSKYVRVRDGGHAKNVFRCEEQKELPL